MGISHECLAGQRAVYLPPWQKEVMFLEVLACLSVCLSVSKISHNVINIVMKFYGGVWVGTMKN